MGDDWRKLLAKVFRGWVNQESLEYGAENLANFTAAYPELHRDYIRALDASLVAIGAGDQSIIEIINSGGGYLVTSLEDARGLVSEFRALYLQRHESESQ